MEFHRPQLQLDEERSARLVLILVFLLLTMAVSLWLVRASG
jgi:hypothetical protein